ncbi:substrate-binding domain-containing protein [Patulibacter sp.]|uniref:substrate-binding domain-containing protein n=1 Tax=Patulibacter sp. TaxID=1912859 RepID=UPI0027170A4F|nr:substrate-binding domain-containing protein [Patulibacter sp.]MDO9407251.1 substrate-binding domain-containing protein [Patulibacter sp.]
MRRTRHLTAGLAVASALAVAGCGVNSEPEMIQSERVQISAREQQRVQNEESTTSRYRALPRRSANQVVLSVPSENSASARAARDLTRERSSVNFTTQVQPTDQGFTDICSGRADVLQTSREITDAERAQCSQNGLDVRGAVVIGYATAVLVTENGRDIGGDCLTLAAVKSMLARGSTITNWRQIGFGSQTFSAAAPPATNPATNVVAIKAFQRPVGAVSLNDFRGDLRTFSDYRDLSDFVTSQDRIRALDRETKAYNTSIARQRRRSDIESIRRAEAIAARAVVRQIQAENKERERKKQAVRNPDELERQNAARVREAKRRARLEQTRKNNAVVNTQTERFRRDRFGTLFSSGRLGVVPYTFYELNSDVLRPLEIDPRTTPSSKRPDCRFPSQQTIVNRTYPLILPVYIYGDRRVLRTASVRVLLTRLLTENAALTRREDLTGLSNTALINTRRSLGLPPIQQTTTTTDGTTTTSTQQSQPTVTNATPNLQPGEIPGVNSRGVESP